MKKIGILVLALLFALPSAFAISLPPMIGMEASDFEIELIDGETFKLSEQRGKVVLINIWATWCGPCVAEMPEIDQLAEDYEDDLVVIGINCGETEQTVADFVEENGYDYLFAADPDYEICSQLNFTNAIPYTIVVDREGVVSALHRGGGYGVYEVLEGYVLDAMGDEGVQILA